MKTYYSHLQSVKSVGEEINIAQKPTFRSSAIFPVLHNSFYSSKIIFMGYWLLKRKIKEIGLLYSLRNKKGIVLSRKYLLIDSAKAFEINIIEFLDLLDDDFVGSIELEIFSTRDLVYPYPAFVLVYYGDNFSTAVHTVGRIYNDVEDMSKNEEYKVKESGFDIYGNENINPFVAFTNGPVPNNKPEINYEINNFLKLNEKGKFTLPPIQAFETVFIKLKDHINLSNLLGDEAATIKIGHNLEGFFPRFAAGNFEEQSKSISITHSYYDSSELKDDLSFWNRKDELFNDSSVSIPLYIINNYYTNIVVYPIFSPSDFTISFSFYDENGNLLKFLKDYFIIKSSDKKYEQIDLKNIIISENLSINLAKSVNVICNWEDKTKIPTRVKFGLNIGKKESKASLPSNICFAPILGNPNILKKQGSFRWAPFLNIGKSEVVLTNSASLKLYDKVANVKIIFHREEDNQTISRIICIPVNGIKNFRISEDIELKEFFNNKSGWLTAESDNPFLNGYYFDFFESGAVGADHIF
jgi:hypothetical protein